MQYFAYLESEIIQKFISVTSFKHVHSAKLQSSALNEKLLLLLFTFINVSELLLLIVLKKTVVVFVVVAANVTVM